MGQGIGHSQTCCFAAEDEHELNSKPGRYELQHTASSEKGGDQDSASDSAKKAGGLNANLANLRLNKAKVEAPDSDAVLVADVSNTVFVSEAVNSEAAKSQNSDVSHVAPSSDQQVSAAAAPAPAAAPAKAEEAPVINCKLPDERAGSSAAIGATSKKEVIPSQARTTMVGKPFPAKPGNCKLSNQAWKKVEELFQAIDKDGVNMITRDNAKEFFKGAFNKISTEAMFNEVDIDGSGAISAEEFASFWVQVYRTGLYKEEDILEELEEMKAGSAWVDWNDGRDTGKEVVVTFPKRPFMCRLSAKCWKKCQELFNKMDNAEYEGSKAGAGNLRLTPVKARSFFQGGFTKVSAEAMFNEIDVDGSMVITADEWMKFWIGVKSAGYKEKEIMEELDVLLEGGAWRDWKDGRTT